MFRQLILLLSIPLAFSLAQGSPRQVDLTKEVPTEQWRGGMGNTSSARTKGLSPLAGERVEITSWHSRFSNLGQQRANWSTRDRFPSPSVQYDTVERDVRPRTMSRLNRQQTALRNVDHRQQRNFVDRYQNAPVGRLETRQDMIHDMVTELSLQDLNRYQFRSSHSTEGGLPVRQPGASPGSQQIRTQSTEGQGQSYIDRAKSFFQTSDSSPSRSGLPQQFSGRRAESATQRSAPSSGAQSAPLAAEPRVETGEVFIKARVLD